MSLEIPRLIAPSELLVRAYFRKRSESYNDNELFATDFRRRKDRDSGQSKETGISLFRLRYLTENQIVKRIRGERSQKNPTPIGLCACSAEVIESIGFKLYAEGAHVNMMCIPCNEVSPVCAPMSEPNVCELESSKAVELQIACIFHFEILGLR